MGGEGNIYSRGHQEDGIGRLPRKDVKATQSWKVWMDQQLRPRQSILHRYNDPSLITTQPEYVVQYSEVYQQPSIEQQELQEGPATTLVFNRLKQSFVPGTKPKIHEISDIITAGDQEQMYADAAFTRALRAKYALLGKATAAELPTRIAQLASATGMSRDRLMASSYTAEPSVNPGIVGIFKEILLSIQVAAHDTSLLHSQLLFVDTLCQHIQSVSHETAANPNTIELTIFTNSYAALLPDLLFLRTHLAERLVYSAFDNPHEPTDAELAQLVTQARFLLPKIEKGDSIGSVTSLEEITQRNIEYEAQVREVGTTHTQTELERNFLGVAIIALAKLEHLSLAVAEGNVVDVLYRTCASRLGDTRSSDQGKPITVRKIGASNLRHDNTYIMKPLLLNPFHSNRKEDIRPLELLLLQKYAWMMYVDARQHADMSASTVDGQLQIDLDEEKKFLAIATTAQRSLIATSFSYYRVERYINLVDAQIRLLRQEIAIAMKEGKKTDRLFSHLKRANEDIDYYLHLCKHEDVVGMPRIDRLSKSRAAYEEYARKHLQEMVSPLHENQRNNRTEQ